VVDEPMSTSITDVVRDPALARRRPGRRSKVAAYRDHVTAWLKEDPELLSVELLRRAKLAGYDGAKSALYALVRTVRPSTLRPVIRFEGLPGEFTQHDFGEVLVHFLNGTTERVHFFASRLKYSRWAVFRCSPSSIGRRRSPTLSSSGVKTTYWSLANS
ncbi:MAG: hypothetical protein ACT4P6_15420, partial [Gemmatimonadaceae bacterium]